MQQFVHVLPAALAGTWLCGVGVVLVVWGVRWRQVGRTLRRAVRVEDGREWEILRRLQEAMGAGRKIPLLLSQELMEPGMFGIFRPVLIWSERLSERLDDEHIEAILAHELMHARRRDNLTAALHMVVEAAFWFHPLVWWMERSMVEERERACDEAVVEMGSKPGVYAESLLKACRFCVESPLVCVAGVTGGELAARVRSIVTFSPRRLGRAARIALLMAGAAAVAAPLALGLAHRPLVFGQILKASGPRPSFEVASIHVWKRPAPPPEMVGGEQVIHQQTVKFAPGNGGGQTSDHVHIIAPLGVLIAQAYGLPPGSDGRGDGRIVGGPDWMTQDDEQYDIQAKIDDQEYAAIQKMTAEQQRERVNLMKQSLLADRFKLQVHFETRELPAYALVVAKGGPKLTAAKEDESTKLSSTRQGQTTEMSATGTTLAQFAESPLLSAGTGSRTVLDQTGLKGKYDFTLKWGANAGAAGQEPSDEPALFTAIQEQLGLQLVPTKGPVEVIVIDHIEKPTVDGAEVPNPTLSAGGDKGGTPAMVPAAETGNAAGPAGPAAQRGAVPLRIAYSSQAGGSVAAQQAQPAQRDYRFEVASIRATPQTSPSMKPQFDAGLYREEGTRLAWLVDEAFGIKHGYQIQGPSWMGEEHFNLNATPPAGATPQDVPIMLRHLLEDRFALKYHYVTRQMAGYELVVVKPSPGLTKSAGPATRTSGPTVEIGKDGEPHLAAGGGTNELWSGTNAGLKVDWRVRNETMAQIASRLADVNKLNAPVVDATGLEGAYDFEIVFAPEPPLDAGASEASMPMDHPLLRDALQKQLGLALRPVKNVPVDVLVIDSANKQPTEN